MHHYCICSLNFNAGKGVVHNSAGFMRFLSSLIRVYSNGMQKNLALYRMNLQRCCDHPPRPPPTHPCSRTTTSVNGGDDRCARESTHLDTGKSTRALPLGIFVRCTAQDVTASRGRCPPAPSSRSTCRNALLRHVQVAWHCTTSATYRCSC